MRKDMFKVIVERPRRGRSRASKTKLRYLKAGDERTHLSGKRLAMERGDRKWLNENLAPLKRYLFKQRGRKWDDVFSEICAHLDTGSTVKMHVREHLDDFIMRKVRIDENGMYVATNPHWGSPQAPDQWRAKLYVDPVDGVIKESDELRQLLGISQRRYMNWNDRAKKKSDDLIRLAALAFLIRVKGLWFEIFINRAPWTSYTNERHIYEELKTAWTNEPKDWKIISKKQLSSKELKTHGLKNTGGNYE